MIDKFSINDMLGMDLGSALFERTPKHLIDENESLGIIVIAGKEITATKLKDNISLDKEPSFITSTKNVMVCGCSEGALYYVDEEGKSIPFENESDREDRSRRITTIKLVNDTELWIGYSSGEVCVFTLFVSSGADVPEFRMTDRMVVHTSPIVFIGKINKLIYTVSTDGMINGWKPGEKDQAKMGVVGDAVRDCAIFKDYLLLLSEDKLTVVTDECVDIGYYEIKGSLFVRTTAELFLVLLKSGDIVVGRFDDEKTESQRTRLSGDDIIDFMPVYKSSTDRVIIHYVTGDGSKKNPGISIRSLGDELEFKSKYAHPSYRKAMMIEAIKSNRESGFSQFVFSSASSRISASSSFPSVIGGDIGTGKTGRMTINFDAGY